MKEISYRNHEYILDIILFLYSIKEFYRLLEPWFSFLKLISNILF